MDWTECRQYGNKNLFTDALGHNVPNLSRRKKINFTA